MILNRNRLVSTFPYFKIKIERRIPNNDHKSFIFFSVNVIISLMNYDEYFYRFFKEQY